MMEGVERVLAGTGPGGRPGSLAVVPAAETSPSRRPETGVEVCTGDPSLPGPDALEAGRRVVAWVVAWVEEARASDRAVWVLLSGGSSSLVASPRVGESLARLRALHDQSSATFHRRFGSARPGHPARTNLGDLYLAWVPARRDRDRTVCVATP